MAERQVIQKDEELPSPGSRDTGAIHRQHVPRRVCLNVEHIHPTSRDSRFPGPHSTYAVSVTNQSERRLTQALETWRALKNQSRSLNRSPQHEAARGASAARGWYAGSIACLTKFTGYCVLVPNSIARLVLCKLSQWWSGPISVDSGKAGDRGVWGRLPESLAPPIDHMSAGSTTAICGRAVPSRVRAGVQ